MWFLSLSLFFLGGGVDFSLMESFEFEQLSLK